MGGAAESVTTPPPGPLRFGAPASPSERTLSESAGQSVTTSAFPLLQAVPVSGVRALTLSGIVALLVGASLFAPDSEAPNYETWLFAIDLAATAVNLIALPLVFQALFLRGGAQLKSWTPGTELLLAAALALDSAGALLAIFGAPIPIGLLSLPLGASVVASCVALALWLEGAAYRSSETARPREFRAAERTVRVLNMVRTTSLGADGAPIAHDLGAAISTPGHLVSAGSIVRLEAGECVPADVVILAGTAEVLERFEPGVLRRAVKGRGEEVPAGSVMLTSTVDARVERTLEESSFGQELAHYERLRSELPRQLSFFESLENLMVGALILTAAVYGLVVGRVQHTVEALFSGVVVVLLSALAVRAAYLLLLQLDWLIPQAVHRGVMPRTAALFWRLASLRSLVVDPALVDEAPRLAVEGLTPLDDRVDRKALSSLLVSIFSHPELGRVGFELADAVRRSEPTPELMPVSSLESEDLGLVATVEGSTILVGSEEFLISRGIHIAPEVLISDGGKNDETGQLFLVSLGMNVVARFVLREDPAPAVSRALAAFRKLNIRTVLVGPGLPMASAPDGYSGLPVEGAGTSALDRLGKSLGLDLSDIWPLSEQVGSKLAANSPSSIVLTADGAAASAAAFGLSERGRHHNGGSDILLFAPHDLPNVGIIPDLTFNPHRIEALAWLVGKSRRMVASIRYQGLFVSALTLFLFAGTLGHFTAPWVAACSLLLVTASLAFAVPSFPLGRGRARRTAQHLSHLSQSHH